MKAPHYSWLICACCTFLLFCTVGLTTNAFLVYQPYIIKAGSLTNTQGSAIITIRSLSSLVSFLFVERFHRKTNIRLGVTLAVICAAVSFMIFGVSSGFIGYCLAGAAAGIAYGLGGMIPVSILIDRWFISHKALALGICAAGTGAAAIIAPPLLTSMIESTSLSHTFFMESAFVAVSAVIIFLLLRNSPEDKCLLPLFTGKVEKHAEQAAKFHGTDRKSFIIMLISIFIIGAISNPGFSHLSVLYESEGYDSMKVAAIISFAGMALTAGKCIYGQITDRFGAYKSGFVFFGALVAGEILCCFAGNSSLTVAMAAMFCLGLGLPISTVGISVFAADSETPAKYAVTLKRFQIVYMIGSLLFGSLPGVIADLTGSYVPFYLLLSVLALASMILTQISYKRMKRVAAHSTGAKADNLGVGVLSDSHS